ncbi:MAG TPA: SgcJ/EcaC family oxidoreductase [Saprospiraceae bacterium]|nr:SgcJ/EcaC family oxidoreductase [Saprospiraceae bacterium]
MTKLNIFAIMAIGFALSVSTISCTTTANETNTKPTNTESAEVQPNLTKIKTEIQALNTTWANAVNNKDAATILNLYAEDAISMPDDAPALKGKAEIKKDVEASTARSKGLINMTYITEEVFGNDKLVTETGIAIAKDTLGKVLYTEKYMALWEKRNGRWQIIREIYNHDAKQK